MVHDKTGPDRKKLDRRNARQQPIKFKDSGFRTGKMLKKKINRGYYTAVRRYEFYFRVVKAILYERAQRVSKIFFYHEKIKFISSSHRVIFFYYIDKSSFVQTTV